MTRIQEIYLKIRSLSKGKRRLCIALIIFLILALTLVVMLMGGWIIKIFSEIIKKTNHSIIWYSLHNPAGRVLSLSLGGVFLFTVVLLFLKVNERNDTESIDDRGVSFMKKGTHGSARWMTDKEAKEVFNVDTAENTTTTIYGQ